MKYSGVRFSRGKSNLKWDLEGLETRVLMSGVIETIARNAIHPLAALPNETAISFPKFSDLWHLKNTKTPGADVHAEQAWDITTGSKNVVIALFDTGIDLNHPDLAGNVWVNPGEIAGNGVDDDGDGFIDDVNGWNFVDGNNNVQDTSGTNHGTTVAGVLGAVGNNGVGISGTNWNVSILTVKVGTDSGVSDQNLIDGINYVKALRAKGVNIVVVNASYLSFGVQGLSTFSAIRSLGDSGVLYVSAAGNSSTNLDNLGLSFILPSNQIYVAATDINDNLASFSSYGKSSVALGAPGADIVTTVRGGLYAGLSGTSYAGPMVSGALALMKAAVPGATAAQLKAALLAGVDVVPGLSGKVGTGGRLNIYKSLLALGAQAGPTQKAPVGWVDALTRTGVSGWAFDENAGEGAVQVQIVVDGAAVATVTANGARADLAGTLGSANHGFAYNFSGLSAGAHTVQVWALDAVAGGGATVGNRILGQGTIAALQTPIGAIDIGGPAQVVGWAIDKDTPTQSVSVRMDVDGVTVATGTANVTRNDLTGVFGSANHGYAFSLAGVSVGVHKVEVFATDTETAAETLVASRTVNTNSLAQGNIDVFNGTTLAGWAFDRNAGVDPIQVLYQIDGHAPTLVTANVTRNDLTGVFGSANHGFSIALPQLMAGNHSVTVWAVDSTTQALTGLGTRTVTVAAGPGNTLPRGNIDVVNGTRVAGWAFDAELAGAPETVRIDVDGSTVATVVANVARQDLVGVLGGANFGYSQALSLSAGQHKVAVYTFDASSNALTLIGSRLVVVPVATPGNVAGPAGAIDVANGTTLAGWAYLPALGGGSATVRVDIDGVPALVTVANVARGDLVGYLGGANYGFSVAMPRMTAGSHSVVVSVVDPVTLGTSVIGTRTVVVG